MCLCVVKGEQAVWGGGAESVQKNYLLGGGDEEALLKQGLFSGGTLECGGNMGGLTVGKGEKGSGRCREGGVCVFVYLCMCIGVYVCT